MDYLTVKKSVDNIKKELYGLKRDLRSNTSDNDKLEQSRNQIKDNFENELESKRSDEYKEYVKNKISPYQSRIDNADKRFKTFKDKYDSAVSTVTKEEIKKSLFGESDIDSLLGKEFGETDNKALDILGERIYTKIKDSDSNMVELEPDEIKSYVNKYKNLLKIVTNLMDINKFLLKGDVKKVFDSKEVKSFFADYRVIVGLLIVTWLVLKAAGSVIAPIVVGIISVVIIYKAIEGWLVVQIIKYNSIIENNLAKIKEREETLVEEEYKKQSEKLEKIFSTNNDKYNSEIQKLKSEVDRELKEARMSFKSTINTVNNKTLDEALEIVEIRLKDVRDSTSNITTRIEELSGLMVDEHENLMESFDDLKKDFIDSSKCGESVIYDGKFLIEVTERYPLFFEHDKESVLLLYDLIDSAFEFATLISLQLRTRLSPFMSDIKVLDTRHLGGVLSSFKSIGEKNPLSYEILTNEDDFSKLFTDIKRKNAQRIVSFQEFGGIDEYNLAMVESDSVPEIYNFIFIFHYNLSLFSNENFKSLLLSGGKTGYYVFNFLRYEDFEEGEKSSEMIVSLVNTIYCLENNEFEKRAKSFVLEEMIKRKD